MQVIDFFAKKREYIRKWRIKNELESYTSDKYNKPLTIDDKIEKALKKHGSHQGKTDDI